MRSWQRFQLWWPCSALYVPALEKSVEEFACLGIGLVSKFRSKDWSMLKFGSMFYIDCIQ